MAYSVEVRFLSGIEFIVALIVGNLLHHTVSARHTSVMRSMRTESVYYMVPLRA